MGMDFYIGDEQIRIANYFHYNEFLNIVSQLGEFPQLLDHSPVHGEYLLENTELSMYKGGVKELKKELEKLQAMKLPDFVADIVTIMVEACELALKSNTKITLDAGSYLGS